jgi:hypothetical protein
MKILQLIFFQVDEIVNTIRGLGEEIENSFVVKNILRSLPMIFDPKISSLEERQDLAMLSMDELHGILTTYEMRTKQENPSRREATFKASKKTRKNKPSSKPCSNNSDDSDNKEEANFVRKLKRGTRKYKGKLPFKCFNRGKFGHFASRGPYVRCSNRDEEEVLKK